MVAFAGDALLCVFYGDRDDFGGLIDSNYCLRALQCAINLRNHRDDHLATHIAVTSGDITLAVLGGYNDEWTYIINGPCMTELSKCIDAAGSQEIVASNSCFLTSELDITCVEDRNGVYLIKSLHSTTDTNDDISNKNPVDIIIDYQRSKLSYHVDSNDLYDIMQYFVPLPAFNALSSGSLENIAELRIITVMFLRLDSYSSTLHQDPVTLQPFFLLFQEVLSESDGFLRQFLVDDKGCVAIAMWGVTSFTFTDNCSRGLFCAVTMSKRIAEVGHSCSIGLTTGNVYCGNVGCSNRQDFVGIGDSVNLAARLMSKADGKVLVDPTTYEDLPIESKQKLVLFDHPLQLKGQTSLIQPYMFDMHNVLSKEGVDPTTSQFSIIPQEINVKINMQLDKTYRDTIFSQCGYYLYGFKLGGVGNNNSNGINEKVSRFPNKARNPGNRLMSISQGESIRRKTIEMKSLRHNSPKSEKKQAAASITNSIVEMSAEHSNKRNRIFSSPLLKDFSILVEQRRHTTIQMKSSLDNTAADSLIRSNSNQAVSNSVKITPVAKNRRVSAFVTRKASIVHNSSRKSSIANGTKVTKEDTTSLNFTVVIGESKSEFSSIILFLNPLRYN